MDRPLNISRYIALVTAKKPSDKMMKTWFDCVQKNAPHGTMMGVQARRNGRPRAVSLIHREQGDQHLLMVPLTRDLLPSESEAIVHAFDALEPGEWDIETSSAVADKLEQSAPSVKMKGDDYITMCVQMAKAKHAQWMREKADAGWRYGTTLSLKNKTHPLMRPWEQLPAKYRKVDTDAPNLLLDVLNNEGYAVVRQQELESLLHLMRGIT